MKSHSIHLQSTTQSKVDHRVSSSNQDYDPTSPNPKKSATVGKKFAHHRKIIIGLILGLGLVLGLLLSFPLIYFFGPQPKILDVTFINPRQALVFWKSDAPSRGYLRIGNTKFWRPTKILQMSDQADVIHTVMLDQLPLDGLYVSPHTEDQSWWQRSPVQLIKYQEVIDNTNNPENNLE